MMWLLILFLYFGFFYTLDYAGNPISFRMIMGAVGVLCFIVNKESIRGKYYSLWLWILLLLFWSLIPSFINGQFELIFIKDVLSFWLNFFGVYALCAVAKRRVNSLSSFFDIIVLITVIQCILEILLFISPSLKDVLLPFIKSEHARFMLDINETRLIGVGTAVYFSSLAPHALSILICVYQIFLSERKHLKFLYIIAYVIIAAVSYLTARTFLAMIGISILMMLYLGLRNNKKTVFALVLSAIVIVPLLSYFVNTYIDDAMYEWAFNSFSSDSKDGTVRNVLSWWINFDMPLDSFIIGDGQFSAPGDRYYKDVDVGYFRALYYFGIIGLTLFLIAHYKIAKQIWKSYRRPEMKVLVLSYLLCFAAIFAKGFASVVSELLLLLVTIDYMPIKVGRLDTSAKSKKEILK